MIWFLRIAGGSKRKSEKSKMRRIELLKQRHDLKKGLRRAKFSIYQSTQESSEFSKQQLKRKINSKAKRTIAQVESKSSLRNFLRPYDWVLGKDGKVRWDENVTSSTDKDLNGRKYIGAGKYDGWNYANKNRNWLEKALEFGPSNVEWIGYHQWQVKNTLLTLIKNQVNRKLIPLTDDELRMNKANWGNGAFEPSKESFGIVDVSNLPTKDTRFDNYIFTDFNLAIGEGVKIPIKGSYLTLNEGQKYIDRFRVGQNMDILPQTDRFTKYSFIFGNKFRKDIFVINISSEVMDDYLKLKNYLGSD